MGILIHFRDSIYPEITKEASGAALAKLSSLPRKKREKKEKKEKEAGAEKGRRDKAVHSVNVAGTSVKVLSGRCPRRTPHSSRGSYIGGSGSSSES